MKKKEHISTSNKTEWEEYLKDPKDIFDKELKNQNIFDPNRRFRFDLHGFTLLDANQRVRKLILECQENGFKEILLITGKGLHSNTDKNTYDSEKLSKLKFSVPEFINSQEDLVNKIVSIEQASINDGGEGAIIIKLKKL